MYSISDENDLTQRLAYTRAKPRENRTLIRPVSQVILRLKPISGQDRFTSTVDYILRWLSNRAGCKLPDTAWQRQSFELSDIGAQHTAAVALENPPYWAARLDDADKSVPLRTWVTEIGVGLDSSGDILLGTRLICANRGEDQPFDRTIPGFVRGIISNGPAELDDEPVSGEPRIVNTESDVDWLVNLLERPSRLGEVIVFSLMDGIEDPTKTAVDALSVSRKTIGCAHTVVLTGPASFYLTDRVGKELSVFRQAVRTYKPGFKAWQDETSRHPIAMPQRVQQWFDEGPQRFEKWLISQTLAASVRNLNREDRLPAFTLVRQLAAQEERQRMRKAGGTDADMLKLYEADNLRLITELKEQKELYDGLLTEADSERENAQEKADEAIAHNLALRDRIHKLQARLNEANERIDMAPIPSNLNEFEAWCKEHLIGSVEVLNRAFQGVKKSCYHNPALLYQALLLLRDVYVPMRLQGGSEFKQAYNEQLKLLEMEDTGTGDGVRFEESEYTVHYKGRKRVLDRHLKVGNSRDPRFCFRLYFFWDDESQMVVVGWLPSHLDNRQT